MNERNTNSAKKIIGDKVKRVGTIISGFYALLLGCLLLLIDYYIDFGAEFNRSETVIFNHLVPVTNMLISILIGISLTTFSVIFVVMQLASSQFSPRILKHFLANDIKTQKFIGLCIGTISLCILPQLASVFFNQTAFILCLAFGSVLAFYCLTWSYPEMITYLSVNMNVSSITSRIKTEMLEEIEDLYQEKWTVGKNLLYKRAKIEGKVFQVPIVSPFESGYLDSVSYKKLAKLPAIVLKSDVGMNFINAYQKPIVGEFIMKDTTVLLVLVFSSPLNDQQTIALRVAILDLIKSTFKVKLFRSATQDINFGVRKLVDIAIKAISPAVNDPTTCLNCIDHIGEIAKELAIREFPSSNSRKLETRHIQINEFNFEEFIDFCFDQIFQWGKEDPTVVKRILRVIRLILPLVENPFNLKILIQQVEEMELHEIYNLENCKNGKLKISKEKLVTVEKELSRFRYKANLQIDVLVKKGILDHYEHYHYTDNSQIINAEREAVQYLKGYAKTSVSHVDYENELT